MSTKWKKCGRVYKRCCPYHDEPTPSMTLDPETMKFHCFGCGAKGNAGYVRVLGKIEDSSVENLILFRED